MTPTPRTPLELGGTTRYLRFTNASIVRMEDETGGTFLDLGDRLNRGSMKALSVLVWAGLIHDDKALKVSDVVEMIDLAKLEELQKAVGKATEIAFGKAVPEDVSEGNVNAA